MATKGEATVLGTLKDGKWVINPDACGLDVLVNAMKRSEPIVISVKRPTRGKARRTHDHKLKLVGIDGE